MTREEHALVQLEKLAYAEVPPLDPVELELLVASILARLYGRSS